MPAVAGLRRYLRQVTDVAAQAQASASPAAGTDVRRAVVASVARAVATALGADIEHAGLRLLRDRIDLGDGDLGDDERLRPPPALVAPELIGQVHAALLAAGDRRRGGVFMTPADVAAGITDVTLSPLLTGAEVGRGVRVYDPAVGGGAFLLAAARRIAMAGVPIEAAVGECVFGSDVDPLAVEAAEAALAILAAADGGSVPPLGEHLVVADALVAHDLFPWQFDAVLANPPFLNQLETATARQAGEAAAMAARFGEAARGYADGAALFLVLGLDVTRPGGRVGMVLPTSVLAARDAGAARQAVAQRGSLEWLWIDGERVFDAGVSVCAVVTEVAGPRARPAVGSPQPPTIARAVGRTFRPLPAVPVDASRFCTGDPWAFLMADALGVPTVALVRRDAHGPLCIGDEAVVTADFRDQFYGLAPLVEEVTADCGTGPGDDGTTARVVTCGLIDPAVLRWGERPMRIGGRRFLHPVVDVERLDRETALGPWARARLVPKVLVATQTRVIEAVVDEAGALLPSTPVITVTAPIARLWHIAAVLLSPPISALAIRTYAGAALAPDAIKLSAKQVAALPLPDAGAAWAWDAAAAAVRAASRAPTEERRLAALDTAAVAMCRAYANVLEPTDANVLRWWRDRLPRPPAAITAPRPPLPG